MTQPLDIDHVTIAGNSLNAIVTPFQAQGFSVQRGGPHAHGATHMSQVCLSDASYIELLSTYKDGDPPRWQKFITQNGGLCAWAISVQDIDAAAGAAVDADISLDGPHANSRKRPDGAEAKWRFAFLGPGDPGTYLPFLIEDRTPRSIRVPNPEGAAGPFKSIERVVMGVKDLSEAINAYKSVFDLEGPEHCRDSHLGAKVAVFDDAPVALARPLDESGCLAQRIETYGPCPAGCIFTASEAAVDDLALVSPPSIWRSQRFHWLNTFPNEWGQFAVTV